MVGEPVKSKLKKMGVTPEYKVDIASVLRYKLNDPNK